MIAACMKHFSGTFDDNCYELATLRWFRDNFVSKEDIEHYYAIAPAIVTEIEKNPNCDELYNYIYEHIVRVCVQAIEQGDYHSAYSRYKNSVLALEEAYITPTTKGVQKVLISPITPLT